MPAAKRRRVGSAAGHVVWRQCDACGKLRKIPAPDAEDGGGAERWYCHSHPDPSLASCNVPQERNAAALAAAAFAAGGDAAAPFLRTLPVVTAGRGRPADPLKAAIKASKQTSAGDGGGGGALASSTAALRNGHHHHGGDEEGAAEGAAEGEEGAASKKARVFSSAEAAAGSSDEEGEDEPLIARMQKAKAKAASTASSASSAPAAPSAPSAPSAKPKLTPSERAEGADLVGKVVQVFWQLDDAWYAAEVLKYHEKSGKHRLVYIEDGLSELVNLAKERWRVAPSDLFERPFERPPRTASGATPRRAPSMFLPGGGSSGAAQPATPLAGTPAAASADDAIAMPPPPPPASVSSKGVKRGRNAPSLSLHDSLLQTPTAPVGGSVSAVSFATPEEAAAAAAAAAAIEDVADAAVPSPKTAAEERGECARTLGEDLVQRYRDQRRQSQALRRASLTTSMVITPTYWKLPLVEKPVALTGGSVASRAERSKQRQLSVSLGDLSGGDLLHLNELKGRKKKLIFGKSAIHSWGLYAAEPIEREDFVVEYLGEYVRGAVAEVREKHYRRYGWGDDYIFRVDKDLLVDATRRGGLARFANHCCEPNCYTRIINAGGKQRIVLYSKERIEHGEEITYNYNFDWEEDRSKAIPCACGSRRCTGWLN